MSQYPNLPADIEVRLRAIVISAEGQGASYLDSPDCPYSPGLKEFLRRILAPAASEIESRNDFEGLPEGDRFDLLLREVETTISSFKALESVITEGPDRVQLFKAKTTLLEKWVGLKERIYSLKEMIEFQSIILTVLDSVVSVDQRAEVMSRLAELKSVPKK